MWKGEASSRVLRVSLPVCLIIETRAHESDPDSEPAPDQWKWPAVLHPLPPIIRRAVKAEEKGVVFDLVGRVFGSHSQSHFRTRFITPDTFQEADKGVYDEFDMQMTNYGTRNVVETFIQLQNLHVGQNE